MGLRFGLLGTGFWALETHGAGLAADPDVDFVGVWGRDFGKASAVADRYGVAAYAEVDALIEEVDAVAIALPPDIQAELAVRAASAGRHLLLDKPLSLSVADADRVVETVEGNGVASVVFFTSRFVPGVADWLQQIQGREWHGARATWFGSIFQPGNPYGASPWRRTKGALWDVGPHALSMTLPLLGPAARITAAGGLGDTVHLIVGHESGASSTLSLSLSVPPAASITDFAVYGPSGFEPMPDLDTTAVEAFGHALAQLRANVDTGQTAHPCDVRFGREVVAILQTAQEQLPEAMPA
ncbi:MAG TPA: Gfo/Idh/MocA family oxidoreductase [Egibacteraceae bacterium]|nr:Gfo/Idh/MocA family oxidoreductase [Egibacteraceae bacterium]